MSIDFWKKEMDKIASNKDILKTTHTNSFDSLEGNRFIFNQDGIFKRVEDYGDPEIIVVNDKSGFVTNKIKFNDPRHDIPLLKRTIQFHGQDIPLIFNISSATIEWMMTDSNVKPGKACSTCFVAKQSVGGKMDFSVYQLPPFVARRVGAYRFLPQDVGLVGDEGFIIMAGEERISPLFIFDVDAHPTIGYNWLDAGNFLWGYANKKLGHSLEKTISLAKSYNKDDSSADLRAIIKGHKLNYEKAQN